MATEDQVKEAWSQDEEFYNYSSLHELVDSHRDDLEVGQTVWVGDAVRPDTAMFFDADDLLDRLGEVAYDNHGECAEDWPGKVSDEAKKEFDDFLAAWIAKHCPPTFWSVENTKPYELTEEDLKDE
jgi:sorbitol-specific phosphotransferase system component IIA